MRRKQTPLGSFFEKGKRPNDATEKDAKSANKKKSAFKRKYRVLLKFQVHCNRWFTFPKPALYNMWRLAIQQNHQTFKTASPHGDQTPCLKKQAPGVFLNKNVNMKNRSNYWRPSRHQICLHWKHHSYRLTTLLKLISLLLLVKS